MKCSREYTRRLTEEQLWNGCDKIKMYEIFSAQCCENWNLQPFTESWERKDKEKAITVIFCLLCFSQNDKLAPQRHVVFKHNQFILILNRKNLTDTIRRKTSQDGIFSVSQERVFSHLHHTLLLKLHLPFSHTHTHTHTHSVTLPSSPYCSNTSRRLWSSWHFYKSASLSRAAGCTSLLLGDDGKMSTDERCLSDNCVQMDTANNSFANQHFKANL